MQAASKAWRSYNAIKSPRMTAFYEQLVNKTTRTMVLTKMLKFVMGDDVAVTSEQLERAFAHADSPRTHRGGLDKVTMEDVYVNSGLVCRMWQEISAWAGPLGYAPVHGTQCLPGPKK